MKYFNKTVYFSAIAFLKTPMFQMYLHFVAHIIVQSNGSNDVAHACMSPLFCSLCFLLLSFILPLPKQCPPSHLDSTSFFNGRRVSIKSNSFNHFYWDFLIDFNDKQCRLSLYPQDHLPELETLG